MASEPPPLPPDGALGTELSPGSAEVGPPPLPPLPPELPPVIPTSATSSLEGRLHPFTILFALWNAIRNFLLPLVIVLLFGRRRDPDVYIWIGSLFIGLPVGIALIKYFTFTYRIQSGELITKQGLLGRTERHIPLGRVQDIRIEQGVLHRLFAMADVFVETAGGRGAEASLSVLSRTEAERLRAAVFEQAHGVTSQASAEVPRVERQTVRQLGLRDLVLAGLTSNRTAYVLAVIFALFQFVDDVLPQDTYQKFFETAAKRFIEWQSNGGFSWLPILLAALGLVVVGVIFSIIGSILVFYGFTLSRSGEDIHRSYGLITRRSSSLPRRRIQLLKIEESWLRRMFKLATLRADTAGGGPVGQNKDEQSGRDVLLPVLPRDDVERILPTFFPDLDDLQTESRDHYISSCGEWQRVSRRAIRRGTKKGTAVCILLAAVFCGIQQNWHGLWPLLFVPLVYVLNVMSYRHLGYSLGERFFRMRSGWLSRATHIVPVRNIQSVVVRQTPFDRRHRVATLLLDSAGQTHTGGGPRISNVPWDNVLVVARSLSHRAANTRYRI